jgi:hypothetical protein
MTSHLPVLWRFRLLRAIKARGVWENRRLLGAWATAEGGTASYNPLNTTQGWPGATDYNPDGVKNYPNAAAGINATAITLTNGYYPGIVKDLQAGDLKAEQIVQRNAAEFDTWGTGSALILSVLANPPR